MVYQGSMNDIESEKSRAQTKNDDAQTHDKQSSQQRNHNEPASRVRQDPRNSDRDEPPPAKSGLPGHLQPETSSSKLTDMLNGPSPRTDSNGDFRILCPSAVPSPLHKIPGPHVAMQPMPRSNIGTPHAGPWASPRSHKTIEDHFFMTNEHLDVVGKTTYDALDMYSKQQVSAMNAKHEQLVVLVEKHTEDLKSQISSVNEKADDASNKTHNVCLKLEQLEKFLKDDVVGAMMEQTKKTAEMETSFREIQKAMTHMQQTVERLSEPKPGPNDAVTTALPSSVVSSALPHAVPTHHSQSALTGHYGNFNDAGRDEQPPMPLLQDHTVSNNYDSHGDPRGNYSSNWQSQAWNGRSTYQGRNKGETASYAGTNPYHFGNGGQYGNGYMNGYSSYNFSPSTSDQAYAYGPKPAQ